MAPVVRVVRLRYWLSLLVFASFSSPAPAASYLPLSDAELAQRAPLIVRASVIGSEVRRAGDEVSTVTTLTVLETIRSRTRGSELSPGDSFSLELPGGTDGDVASWAPGTPEFARDAEVVLFLAKTSSGGLSLTELGMSKFDLAVDADGRAFAVRPVFADDEDDRASNRRVLRPLKAVFGSEETPRQLRDADSFLAMLRATAAGAPPSPVVYTSPNGILRGRGSLAAPGSRRPLWVNIGGVEGTGAQFRWFWDTGLSPAALVSAAGTQTGLSDGSNGVSAVQNGAAGWSSVPGTTVRYSFSSGTAPVVVNLDVDSKSPAWTTPLSCGSGGIIGYGGPGPARSTNGFKGESSFYAPSSGDVWMRRVTGGCYSASTFRAAVLHELGHTLGLGHSDEGASTHSTTTPGDWNSAVMHSVIPAAHPSTPQTDDIQAITYYYGTGSVSQPPAPSAAFGFSPASPAPGQTVAFTDGSTDAPTAWVWSFGDGGAALTANPTHAFSSPGSYTVSLTVTNAGGSSTTTRTVTVASAPVGCGPGALCLNGNRFRVSATWRVPSQGTAGAGTPVALTGDTGYFWFFSSNNVELVVKVVDGRTFNGHFWVFSGALSDVEYTIRVTDTVTGAVRSYSNPSGRLSSFADVSAF
jgi:PKD repeat protein